MTALAREPADAPASDAMSGLKLPRASELRMAADGRPPAGAALAVTERDDGRGRNPLFGLLVRNDTDVAGLLAYGLYKQNKRDWLAALSAREARDPTEAETSAFILSESLPRRIATYRRLAEDMLAAPRDGGPDPRQRLLDGLGGQPANDSLRTHAAVIAAARKPVTWRYVAFLLAMLVVMAVLFRLAAGWLFGTGR